MAFFSFLDPVLNALFGPLLYLDPLLAMVIISFAVVLLMTLITKYCTDQNLMKQLKDEMKEFQKQIKELKDQPDKAMAVQKQAMQTNMKYMMAGMKSTFISMIPIILILGWFHAHFAFVPFMVGQEFTVSAVFDSDGKAVTLIVPDGLELVSEAEQKVILHQKEYLATWGVRANEAGTFTIQVEIGDRVYPHKVMIDEHYYAPQSSIINQGGLREIRTNYEPLRILPGLGWGWLGTYIVFSIVWSILLRKALNVY